MALDEKHPPRLDEGRGDEELLGAPDSRRPRRRAPPLLVALGLVLFLLALPRLGVVCWRRAAGQTSGRGSNEAALAGSAGFNQEHELARPGEAAWTPTVRRDEASASVGDARPKSTALDCFQVAQPVLTPSGATTSGGLIADGTAVSSTKPCTVLLMNHSFGNSYNQPFIGEFRRSSRILGYSRTDRAPTNKFLTHRKLCAA